MLTFQVDFNDQTDDRHVVALARLASGCTERPVPGMRCAPDSEGNRMRASVERVDRALVYVCPTGNVEPGY